MMKEILNSVVLRYCDGNVLILYKFVDTTTKYALFTPVHRRLKNNRF